MLNTNERCGWLNFIKSQHARSLIRIILISDLCVIAAALVFTFLVILTLHKEPWVAVALLTPIPAITAGLLAWQGAKTSKRLCFIWCSLLNLLVAIQPLILVVFGSKKLVNHCEVQSGRHLMQSSEKITLSASPCPLIDDLGEWFSFIKVVSIAFVTGSLLAGILASLYSLLVTKLLTGQPEGFIHQATPIPQSLAYFQKKTQRKTSVASTQLPSSSSNSL